MSDPKTTSSDNERPAMAQALQQATQEFISLVGVEPESLSGVEPTDGGWRFWIEVEELARVPPSTSVMASYEVTTDGGGGISGFRKARRYLRSQTMNE